MTMLSNLCPPRYRGVRLRLADLAYLGYMALLGLTLLFIHGNVPAWPGLVVLHAALIVLSLEIVRWGERSERGSFAWALRTFYTLPLMLISWSELNLVLPLLFDSFWATDTIIRIDRLVFGVHPTVWLEQRHQPWLDQVMNAIYSFYFLFFLVAPLCFFLRRKYDETLAMQGIVNFVYYANYLFFFLLPAVSPLHAPALAGMHAVRSVGAPAFAGLIGYLQSIGSVHGAAFPSTHVSGAAVWALAAGRYSRTMGWMFAPISVGMGIASVYLGYHHAMDPIAGYLWGGLGFLLAVRLTRRRGEDPLDRVAAQAS